MIKKLVLIGDSIRMGYEPTVRTELADRATIWAPETNGQHTVNVLLNFMEWVVYQKPDVLHINAGGWDTRNVIRGKPGNIVPLEVYEQNVRRILTLAREYTPAKIIWATITPIDQEQNFNHHAKTGIPGRVGTDIPLYNESAKAIARSLDIEINDLHKFVSNYGVEKIRLNDGVHYSDEGYQVLGKEVARVLRSHL